MRHMRAILPAGIGEPHLELQEKLLLASSAINRPLQKILRLNIRLMTLAVLAILATSIDFAYGAKAQDDAIKCAKEWLSLVDAGLFAESWKAGGTLYAKGLSFRGVGAQT